ncbi:hypothetical protein [Arthrobacter sp. HLT1-20]
MKILGKSLAFSVTLLSVAGFGFGSVPPATAATQATETLAQASQTCVIQVATGMQNCYPQGDDWVAATEVLTGTPVIQASTAAEYKAAFEELSQNARGVAPLAVTLILGYLYDDINYGGGNQVFTATANSAASCGGGTWKYHNLADLGWSNRASAMKPQSGCAMRIWENVGTTGSNKGGYSSVSWLGALSDKGKSLSWTP